jgi:hypothetical protein
MGSNQYNLGKQQRSAKFIQPSGGRFDPRELSRSLSGGIFTMETRMKFPVL